METGLRGKVVLITGAAGTIGGASALAFAREGARLALATRKSIKNLEATAARVRALGAEALASACDVTDPVAVQTATDRAIREFGRIDVVVNAATVWPPLRTILDASIDDWNAKIAVDLYGSVRVCQAAIPGMVEQGWGRVVNFSGTPGAEGDDTLLSTTMMGVIGFTRGLAGSFAANGITANCVSPGAITSSVGSGAGRDIDEAQPIKRPGTPDEVASLVVYLASGHAGYITGQVYSINGGRYYGNS